MVLDLIAVDCGIVGMGPGLATCLTSSIIFLLQDAPPSSYAYVQVQPSPYFVVKVFNLLHSVCGIHAAKHCDTPQPGLEEAIYMRSGPLLEQNVKQQRA